MSETITIKELLGTDANGRTTVPLDRLHPYTKNPRRAADFEYPGNAKFKDLVESIELYGVLEPIQIFLKGEWAEMITGHRRREAVLKVNELRKEALAAKRANGELSEDQPTPVDLQPITEMPITVIPEPPSDFDRQKGMWNSEVLREKWPFDQTIKFFRETLQAAPAYLQNDPKELARNLGLPVTRVKLLVSVASSDVLYDAARSSGKLPLAGREKTLRSVERVAQVIHNERQSAARAVTGSVVLDDAALEKLRSRTVDLASKLKQPGVALEQIAPLLRDAEKHPDELVSRMLKGDVDAAEEILEDFRGSRQPVTVDSLAEVTRQLTNVKFTELSAAELDERISDLLGAAELVDKALAAAKAAKRQID